MSPIEGPGWVDHSDHPIGGRYPLGVERYLNSAVGKYAAGVTTQTSVARYYALHGLIAHEGMLRGLDVAAQKALLRRAEVAYAVICLAHRRSPEHPGGEPSPHGILSIDPWLNSEVDLDVLAGYGDGRYAQASWGFWGQYVGAETALGVLNRGDGLLPGPTADAHVLTSALAPVLEFAASKTPLTLESAAEYAPLCLCQMGTSEDGDWLARVLAGRVERSLFAHEAMRATLSLLSTAMRDARITNLGDLNDFVMYDPRVLVDAEDSRLWRVWRGLRFRAESVSAWTYLWAHVTGLVGQAGGVLPIGVLGDRLADEVGPGTVGGFVGSLPAIMGGGDPLPAEREVREIPEPVAWMATLALGALRYRAMPLDGSLERLGFVGEERSRSAREELSPYWMSLALERWNDRSLQDFARHLVNVMVHRAHRLTFQKAYERNGRLVMPLRIRFQDGLVTRIFEDGGSGQSLRWPNLLSIGRQVGLFTRTEDGLWEVGPRGDYLT